jgi:outer membrane protein TolC
VVRAQAEDWGANGRQEFAELNTSADAVPPGAEVEGHARVVPITLDTVLRLAEEQNPQIAIARERVNEACGERAAAVSRWLPDVYLGAAYYRHEGGIQDFTGQLIQSSYGSLFGGLEVNARLDLREVAYHVVQAERKTWQSKGELSRITSETLLEASSAYIDLLAARTGIAIARNLLQKMEDLLQRTKKQAVPKIEPGLRVEVERIQADVHGQQVLIRKLESQAAAAAAKLTVLLGLDPGVVLVPVDPLLMPIEVVDLNPPACELVARALENGPGIREMEGMLAVIHEAMERASGPARFLPIFEVRLAEGSFGAGPGASLAWDNRWDLGVQARWNLTEFAALKERREVTRARLAQIHLSYEDLRRKLAVGVQQLRDAILSDRDEIQLSEEQINHARQAHNLSKQRLDHTIPGATPSEVLLSIQSLARAQLNYISSVREYNKDQLRLMILLGPGSCLPAIPSAVVPE